jgi:hypothetical protein
MDSGNDFFSSLPVEEQKRRMKATQQAYKDYLKYEETALYCDGNAFEDWREIAKNREEKNKLKAFVEKIKGDGINNKGFYGKTPLLTAVENIHYDAVRALLKAGASPRILYDDDKNLLDYIESFMLNLKGSKKTECIDICKLLVEYDTVITENNRRFLNNIKY